MTTEWIATVGEQAREVEVTLERRRGGRYWLRIDGEPVEVDAAEVGAGTWSILLGDRSYLVDLSRASDAVSAVICSNDLSVLLEDARRKSFAQAVGRTLVAQGEIVRAPIAGRVVAISVDIGAEVQAGDSVAVLEAMKMENEIRATKSGRVESIHASPGESVDSNQPLLTLA